MNFKDFDLNLSKISNNYGFQLFDNDTGGSGGGAYGSSSFGSSINSPSALPTQSCVCSIGCTYSCDCD